MTKTSLLKVRKILLFINALNVLFRFRVVKYVNIGLVKSYIQLSSRWNVLYICKWFLQDFQGVLVYWFPGPVCETKFTLCYGSSEDHLSSFTISFTEAVLLMHKQGPNITAMWVQKCNNFYLYSKIHLMRKVRRRRY